MLSSNTITLSAEEKNKMSLAMVKEKLTFETVTVSVPLRIDEGGGVRVGNTRVTLDIIVDAFNAGVTAEEMVCRYPVLKLVDVYAVISYYLRHQEEIDAYLLQEEFEAETFRQQNPYSVSFSDVRDRLLARQEERKRGTHVTAPR